MQQNIQSLKLALDWLPNGVILADPSGQVVFANKPAELLLGLHDRGAADVVLYSEGEQVSLGELIQDHLATKSARRRIQLEHPEHGWFRSTLSTVNHEFDPPMVHMIIEAGPRRDWRWAGRSDPLSSVSHELRNVLLAVQEGLSLLNDEALGPLSEQQKAMFDGVRNDAVRMQGLVDNLLTASRTGPGTVRMKARRVDLADLATQTVGSFDAVAERKGITLKRADVAEELWSHADPKLLEQAVTNLLSNAMKFTEPGGTVTASTGRWTDDGGQEMFGIAVEDTGCGMSIEQIERVLGTGTSGDKCSEGSRGGMGIGLSIVKEIMAHHGGSLGAESEEGRGSTFRLLLPPDFRTSQHWRATQVAGALKLAQMVNVPLSIVKIGIVPMSESAARLIAGQGLLGLPVVEQCLMESLRPSDTAMVGEASVALLLYDTDRQGARVVGERSTELLSRIFGGLPEHSPRCGITFGIASFPTDGSAAAELLKKAREELERFGGGRGHMEERCAVRTGDNQP